MGKLKALVVDTDRALIAQMSGLMRRMGFGKTLSAESALEALRTISLWPPDMVIVGIELPGVNGIALINRIKSDGITRRIPVIAIAASDEDGRRAIETGALEALNKPVSLSRLNSAMQNAIALSGANRRQHLRAPYQKTVTLAHKGRTLKLEGRNLSEGGIFVYMDAPPPVGSFPQVGLVLGGRRRLLRGRVIYHLSLPKGQGGPLSPALRGMAVKFTRLDDETRAALKREVERLLHGG